jgi:hypothetical protein
MKVPESVVSMPLAANGDAGGTWLAALPAWIDELRQRWSLTEIAPAFEGGCVAFVAPAVRADGSHVVLKVSFLDEETEHEGDALALWNGTGAVRLLDTDPQRGALLLERLEPGTSLAAHPDREAAVSTACSLRGGCGCPPRRAIGSKASLAWRSAGLILFPRRITMPAALSRTTCFVERSSCASTGRATRRAARWQTGISTSATYWPPNESHR